MHEFYKCHIVLTTMINMFQLLLALIGTILAVQGNAVSISPRNGILNTYFVYTQLNTRTPEPIPSDIETTDTSILREDRQTIVLVHGHNGDASSSLNPLVKDATLLGHDFNVIVVDWSAYSTLSYSNAVSAVPSVGVSLATFLQRLATQTRIKYDDLHLVGFGLGAHVVGFAGRTLERLVGRKVPRITGLDPSGDQWGSNTQRLTSTDASYVEVIHTDGQGVLANGIGTALGHVDIFPNGGTNQPGCLAINECSHNRAYELFAASLNYDHLTAYQCSTTSQINLNDCHGFTITLGGVGLNKIGSGLFRINTARTYPY